MTKIRVSKGLKSKYLQLWAGYSIRSPETPYLLSINGLLTAIGHLRCCRWPISWIFGPKGEKSLKMTKIRVSKGLKSKYLQLWAEYSIRTPETPYILSINGLLTAIGHLRSCRWPISWILGPKGDKSLKMTKIRVSKGLKSKYLQLWAEY